MRLLSFFKQVETTLAMLHPDCAGGWNRRADYRTGTASCWQERTGLSLSLRTCELGDGRYSLQTRWTARGTPLSDRTFFCGVSPYDWQSAADAVAEAMPDPAASPAVAAADAPAALAAASA
jgi:hypothetical protein